MCMGLPMQVIETGFYRALCDFNGEKRDIDTLLVGEVKAGDWLLVFIDAAREIISEETAIQIKNALTALELAMKGDSNIDHLFADLTGHSPITDEIPTASPSLEKKV